MSNVKLELAGGASKTPTMVYALSPFRLMLTVFPMGFSAPKYFSATFGVITMSVLFLKSAAGLPANCLKLNMLKKPLSIAVNRSEKTLSSYRKEPVIGPMYLLMC